MFRFILKKLLHKKWMTMGLLLGNILLTAVASANPMYQSAARQKLMNRLVAENGGDIPGLARTDLMYTLNTEFDLESALFRDFDEIPDKIEEALQVPAEDLIIHNRMQEREISAVSMIRQDGPDGSRFRIGCITDLWDHITIIETAEGAGKVGSVTDGILEAAVSRQVMAQQDFLLGEIYEFEDFTDAVTGENVRFRIAAVFELADGKVWPERPDTFEGECFVSEDTYFQHIYQTEGRRPVERTIYQVFDYQAMEEERGEELLAIVQQLDEEASWNGRTSFEASFEAGLSEYVRQEGRVTQIMWILQLPIFLLLAAFLVLVSGQLYALEDGEISMLRSRGAGKLQIVGVYVGQSTILALAGGVIGLLLGFLLCVLIGTANGFMSFENPVDLSFRPGLSSIGMMLAAALVSVLVMTLPVLKYARVTIVEQKRKKRSKPIWQRFFLDFLCVAVSAYGWYSFGRQEQQIREAALNMESFDPFLFLCPYLFLLGAALILLRILPLLIQLLYRMFRIRMKPETLAAFLQIMRNKGGQGFLCLFLMLTAAMGIMNASMARTLERKDEDEVRYRTGADLVLQERWESNAGLRVMNPELPALFYEPDLSRYDALSSQVFMTAVIRDEYTRLSVRGVELSNVLMLGIDTKEFGETAWMKDGLTETHWYEDLNKMAVNTTYILVSRNFQEEYEMQEGDVLYFEGLYGGTSEGTIAGFVDYFPGYTPQEGEYLIVAHRDQIQADYGSVPYELWMKTNGNSDAVYQFLEEAQIPVERLLDVEELIREAQGETIYQITCGVLTINYLVVLILCMTGFLIFWTLSIKARELLFGVYRAMGLTMKEIMKMLFQEQFFLSILTVLSGTGIGIAAAAGFVLRILPAFAKEGEVLPAVLYIDGGDILVILISCAVMVGAGMAILGWLVARIRIAQALKLGEL